MVDLHLRCIGEFTITREDGSEIRYNGGPSNFDPQEWRLLRDTLRAMTVADAEAQLKADGWTWFDGR